MKAEIIAVGSELLGPDKLDTNSLYLTKKLGLLGIPVTCKTVVGDDMGHLTAALAGAMARSDLVITTGGLGPTLDDLTRDAAAAVTGRKLVLDYDLLAELEDRYRERGIQLMANSEKQAMVLVGSEPIPNGPGSAPGVWLAHDGRILVLLPGVPREMMFMMEQTVLPKLAVQFHLPERMSVSLNLAGIPESVVDQRIRAMDVEQQGVAYTILANLRRVQITLSGEDPDPLRRLSRRIKEAFGPAVFGEGDVFLEHVVLARLADMKRTVALAESCTGGLAAKWLTDVPGSSRSFLGGVVAYHNQVKTDLLGVSESVLTRYGAVSSQTAVQMAIGARRRIGSDYAGAVTGIAGPGHDGVKPVGLVYLAVTDGKGTWSRRFRFRGDREMVRIQSATRLLDLLRRRMEGLSP